MQYTVPLYIIFLLSSLFLAIDPHQLKECTSISKHGRKRHTKISDRFLSTLLKFIVLCVQFISLWYTIAHISAGECYVPAAGTEHHSASFLCSKWLLLLIRTAVSVSPESLRTLWDSDCHRRQPTPAIKIDQVKSLY